MFGRLLRFHPAPSGTGSVVGLLRRFRRGADLAGSVVTRAPVVAAPVTRTPMASACATVALVIAGLAGVSAAGPHSAPVSGRSSSSGPRQTVARVQVDLADAIRGAIRGAGLDGATIAVSVRDPESERELVAINGDRPLIPASNMKLLTSGAALHHLGPEFAFETHLCTRGRRGTETERLIVVGDGDPGFGDPALLARTRWTDRDGVERTGMTGDELVGLWVGAVVDEGIRSVREVVVDDRVFARERFHPSWPSNQRLQRSFAEVAGLNFQVNVLQFFLRPGRGPRPEIAAIRPAVPWIEVTNKATAKTGKAEKHTPGINRVVDRNAFTIQGNVKFAGVDPIEIPVHDPPMFFAELLADRLRAAGVTVGSARLAQGDDSVAWQGGRPAPDHAAIGPIVRTPLAEVLRRCNTNSQNVHAEALLKRTAHRVSGRPGSWADGADAVERAVSARLGSLDSGQLVVADGSGLSRQNRASASLLTAWLESFHADDRLGPMLVESLAVGGESGTLRTRFGTLAGAPVAVQCKTGYLNGVSCLSGYVTAEDGTRRSFAILGNDLTRSGAVGRMKKLQETIVALVAEQMGAPVRRAAR